VTDGNVSPEVRRFIAEHIEAAEQLETLLLLHRSPEKEWTALDVSQAIYTVPASATMRLEGLVAYGFVVSSGGADPRYRYSPRSEELGRQVDVLAAAYRADRVAVIKLIFARPPDPLQSFADAFRLRGKGE
jgi:saccharopine dehydrogenase-like NADP-dependent oxidoreductase